MFCFGAFCRITLLALCVADFPCAASAESFFPTLPPEATVATAVGVLSDFGIGNHIGSLEIKSPAGTTLFYTGQDMTVEGSKENVCAHPPQAGELPDEYSPCRHWPSDIVIGRTTVAVRYWKQKRPDTNEDVLVAEAITVARVSTASGLSRAALIDREFTQAYTHDADAILRDRSSARASGDGSSDHIFGLALYVASPKTYANDFVASFPTTTSGVMRDYGVAIGEHGWLKSPMTPFEALGKLAAGGNGAAFEKLLRAYTASDGGVAQSLGDAIKTAVRARPSDALVALADLPESDAKKLFAEPRIVCGDGLAKTLTSASSRSGSAAAMQKRLATLCASSGAGDASP